MSGQWTVVSEPSAGKPQGSGSREKLSWQKNSLLTAHCMLEAIAAGSLLTAIILILASCSTVPKNMDSFSPAVSNIPLETGASVYAVIDVKNSRAVLEKISLKGLEDKQKKQILNRTNTIYAGFYKEKNEIAFQLAVYGNFSDSQGAFIFGMNKDWKKYKCDKGHKYWYSQKNNMSITMNSGKVLIIQTNSGKPAVPCTHSEGINFPSGFISFSKNTYLSGWLSEPGSDISEIFEKIGVPLSLPVENVFFSMIAAASDTESKIKLYEGIARVQTLNATQARGLLRIISMARLLSSGLSLDILQGPWADILLANEPVQDDKYLIFKTKSLNADEIALLIESLLIK